MRAVSMAAAGPFFGCSVRRSGWSHDQAVDLDALGNVQRAGNFAHDGFTHWEAGVALPMTLGELSVEPSAHLIFGNDDWVRLASTTRERDVKFWFGITVGGARSVPGL